MTTDVQPLDRTITAHGLRLHYLDWGGDASVPALALHGFALNCHSWDEVAPALRSRLRLRALDQRGHGRSQWANEMREYTRDHMVRDIEAVVAGLELERPVLIGHSMGGGVAMTFAARHPEQVRALVLVDTGPEVSPEGAERVHEFVAGPYVMDSLDAWVEHTAKYYPHRSKDGIRKRLAVSLRETPDGMFAKQFDERFTDREYEKERLASHEERQRQGWEIARRLRCPTLLLHGGDSPVVSLEAAERFAAEVPVARMVSIPGAAHSVAGDQPEAFVAAVSGFFDEVLTE